MMWNATELTSRSNSVFEHALDVLFIVRSDHEQNCSEVAAGCRVLAAASADPGLPMGRIA